MVDFGEESNLSQMRVLHQRVRRVHGSRGDVVLKKKLHPGLGRPCLHRLGDKGIKFACMTGSGGEIRNPRIVFQLIPFANGDEEISPIGIGIYHCANVPVLGFVWTAIRISEPRVCRGPLGRDKCLTLHVVSHDKLSHRLEHRNFNMLPTPRPLARVNGGQNDPDGVNPNCSVS